MVGQRHLQRRLHRLRTRVREKDVVEPLRRHVDEAGRGLERLHVPHLEGAGEVERLDLLLDGRDDLWPAMPGVDAPQPRRTIHHAPPVWREVIRTFGLGEETRRALELPVRGERHPEGFEIVGLELHVHDVCPRKAPPPLIVENLRRMRHGFGEGRFEYVHALANKIVACRQRRQEADDVTVGPA